ncbi:MAG TPA: ornithine carbamoyltransferase [Acidimicrobiales bacterium]|nr:ornithine carbamoyltransferase [Acidimicrobiales bacterium]
MAEEFSGLRRVRGRHFLTDLDYEREDLERLLRLAIAIKARWRRRPLTPFLPGRHLAMIFEAASTRTRVSFENGFAELGGNALYLRPGEIHLPGRESVADTARTLSQYNSAIVIRAKTNETVNELAAWSTVPVINAMDHDRHPCQAMSDALTILEYAGKLQGVTFAYVGDAAHPCNSLSTTLTKLGLNVRVGNAPGYEIGPEVRQKAQFLAARSGGSFLLTSDPLEAIDGADFVYTDCWWWTGQEAEYADRVTALRPFQVNSELWSHTKPGAKFMHCLPAMRGEEVTNEIADSPASIIFPQAQNRLHFQKALMLALIGLDEVPADPELHEIAHALLA